MFPPLALGSAVFGRDYTDIIIPVNEVTAKRSSCQTSGYSQGERGCREGEADAADEDDCLQTLAKDGDEGQEEHGVLFGEALEPLAQFTALVILGFHGLGNLQAPFVLQLGHAQQSGTHDCDDDGCDQTKGTFPDVRCGGEVVDAVAVEGTDDATTNDEADCETGTDTPPNL